MHSDIQPKQKVRIHVVEHLLSAAMPAQNMICADIVDLDSAHQCSELYVIRVELA